MSCPGEDLDRKLHVSEEARLNDVSQTKPRIKLYKIRWFMVFLFALYAASSAFQWLQYCIISKIMMRYYSVSALAIDWTSLISMITYPPLIIPGSYIIDKMGLRVCALLGVIGTTIGTWIKAFSLEPHLFWLGFSGQTVLYVAQIFILSLPPRIASVWFGENEVSKACGLGVFGTQVGTAVGFIIPPMVIRDHANIADITTDMQWLFYGVAIYTSVVAVFVVIFFKSEPKTPPSQAQIDLKSNNKEFTKKEFYNSYKRLLRNKPFIMLMFSYGINIGTFAGICTILNQLILAYFPDNEQDSGRIGFLLVVIGMMGSLIFGYLLDKTRKYKETTLVVYIMVTIGVAAFMFALEAKSMTLLYISSAFMGFFQSAYYPVGFEMGTELTFPEPESTSSGLLISMAQTFGVIFTLLMDRILTSVGPFWALASMVALLCVGCILTAVTPNVLRRQEAFQSGLQCKFTAVKNVHNEQ